MMLLHLSRSKFSWFHAPRLALPPWGEAEPLWAAPCVEVVGLGTLTRAPAPQPAARGGGAAASDGNGSAEVVHATRYGRHRVTGKHAECPHAPQSHSQWPPRHQSDQLS